jgi:hypothetical protein
MMQFYVLMSSVTPVVTESTAREILIASVIAGSLLIIFWQLLKYQLDVTTNPWWMREHLERRRQDPSYQDFLARLSKIPFGAAEVNRITALHSKADEEESR